MNAPVRTAAMLAACCYFLTGCSAVSDLFATEQDSGPRTAAIAVLVPAEGEQAAAGTAVTTAVELAVDDAGLAMPDWTVQVFAVDDTGDAAGAVAAAELVAADDVVAVVGGLSGGVVRAVQPVLEAASIPFVSPADVTAEHTRGADPAAPLRPYRSYFTTAVAGGDPVQVAAHYAVVGLGATKVAVVDGGSADAAEFVTEARRLGADVVAVGPAGADGTGIDQVISTAVTEQADAIYTTTGPAASAVVAKKLAGTGLDARLIGGSALRADDFVSAAGTAADGTLAVVPGSGPPDAGAVPAELAARLGDRGLQVTDPVAAAAYDAGAALATVLRRCLPAERSAADAREGCLEQLQQASFTGMTGHFAFDRYGERAGSRPAVYEYRDGEWAQVGA